MAFITFRKSNEYLQEKGKIKSVTLAGNGIFEEKKSWLGVSNKKVSDYHLPKLPNEEEYLNLNFETNFPKLDLEMLYHIIKWYRDITLKDNKEAQVVFYKGENLTQERIDNIPLSKIEGVKIWNENLFSYVPKQINSQGETAVLKDLKYGLKDEDLDKYYEIFNKRFGIYLETHSHNSMNAFRSGTDKNNSENDGIQLVFGKLNQDEIEMFSWATVRDLQRAGLSEDELSLFIKLEELPQYEMRGDFEKEELKLFLNYHELEKKVSLKTQEDTKKELKKWDNQIVERPIVKYEKQNNIFNLWGYKNHQRNEHPMQQLSMESYFEESDFDDSVYIENLDFQYAYEYICEIGDKFNYLRKDDRFQMIKQLLETLSYSQNEDEILDNLIGYLIAKDIIK